MPKIVITHKMDIQIYAPVFLSSRVSKITVVMYEIIKATKCTLNKKNPTDVVSLIV